MSDSQTEQLFDTLVQAIEKKLSTQEQTIKSLRDELTACKLEINEIRKLHFDGPPVAVTPVAVTQAAQNSSDCGKPNDECISRASAPITVQDLMNIDLTALPSYKYVGAFKEVKRPTNLNELYMVILQAQHLLYELKTHTDNILRRN